MKPGTSPMRLQEEADGPDDGKVRFPLGADGVHDQAFEEPEDHLEDALAA